MEETLKNLEAPRKKVRKNNSKGMAAVRIEIAVKTIIRHNNSQDKKEDKIRITRSAVFKLTNSKRKNINKYFENNQEFIEKHNLAHDLTSSQNWGKRGKSIYKTLRKYEQSN